MQSKEIIVLDEKVSRQANPSNLPVQTLPLNYTHIIPATQTTTALVTVTTQSV